MGKVVAALSMSLDRFIAVPSGDLTPLYPDFGALEDDELVKESIASTGAVVVGVRASETVAGECTSHTAPRGGY